MSLRLTVLGGAAAWPNPGQGCSSYLIEADSAKLLIDCGPDTLSTLRAHVDYHDVNDIILSHWHADHVLDIVPYRYGLIYGPGSRSTPIRLWVPPGVGRRLEQLASALIAPDDDPRAFWSSAFDIREYNPDATLSIDSFDVSFLATQHYVYCCAVRVEHRTSGHVICYSADTGLVEPLVDLFRDASLGVIEATLDDHGTTPPQERGHLTPEDAGRLARMANIRRLLVTHLWSERDPTSVVARAATEFGGPVIAAEAGLVLDA